ncbi:MAG: hypothetical protein HY608_02965, partial [Planctomycetes bacterium]|nr:hypothetical protein [Planctomycetota bacterium]
MEEPRPALGTETFDRLHDLIPFCVREILLVSSLYDSFILGEDLQLTEQLLNSFQDMGLSYPPRVTRVDNAERALQALKERPFDMVLATMRLGGMAPVPFAQEVKRRHPNLPVILLAYSTAALPPSPERQALPGIDKVFVWSGDSGILLSIVKFVEDRLNADHDTRGGKVRVLILVENSARYYSSFLPLIYSEIVRHTVALLSESFNPMQKRLRMRARPKILLAETYEEGLALYLRYRSYVLGILSDVRFPREQRLDPKAGFRLVEEIWRHDPVLPILLQSSARENEAHARALGLPFLNKTSPTLLQDLRSFLLTDLGFGEFTFRAGDGRTFGSAATASDLLRLMREVPDESLSHHAERHHFSNWFYARGEFELADALRSRRRGDFKAPTDLRDFIVRTIHPFAEAPATSDPDEAPGGSIGAERFSRVGGGSMGGKARGMAFLGTLLAQNRLATSVPGAILSVPRSMVIGTDAFDEFLRQNPLREAALEGAPDAQTAAAFVRAPLPESVASQIARFLEREHRPLAVRSSSLLEDSQELPLAGIYATYMLPNNHPDLRVRMGQLCTAVRMVYA